MRYLYILTLLITTQVFASEDLSRTPGAMLPKLAPVNVYYTQPTPVPVAVVPEPLKFDLYTYQKNLIQEEEERKALAEMPSQPLVIVVNQPAPPPEPENPLVSFLKFGVGVASRGLLRF